MNSKSIIASLSVVILTGIHTAAQAQNDMGMTWKTRTPNELLGPAGKIGNQRIVLVGCSGCNAYKGDTSIQEKLRILCIVPGNQAEPAIYDTHFSGRKFYYGWSGAKIGLTKKRKGVNITSKAVGDQFCKTDLADSQARMIEHHDNKVGGWNVGGFIHPNSKAKGQLKNPNSSIKFWASIKNQPANPWD